MPASALIIITHKLDFSNQIISYFQSINPLNAYNLSLIGFGLDENDDELSKQAKKIADKLIKDTKLKQVVIFSDLGYPSQLAKRIKFDNPEIQVLLSEGNLIENGYLTYILLNTKAPIEVISEVINRNIRNL